MRIRKNNKATRKAQHVIDAQLLDLKQKLGTGVKAWR